MADQKITALTLGTPASTDVIPFVDLANGVTKKATKADLTGATGATGATGPGYTATSTTSLAIGTGSKTFTTQSGLAYTVGARVRAASAGDTSKWMEGLVTSYSTTSMVVSMDLTNGSGTLADWNINLAGERGATGATGATGDTGPAGADGTGTVNSVSVVSANGLAGSVANATTTPAITLSTTITGVLKGNGTAISAATAGTDFTSPTSTETMTNKTLTAPRFASGGFIADANGNELVKFTTTASAVDELTITNSATGLSPNVQVAATGDDTNIILTLSGKGTGEMRLGSSTSSGIKLLGDQPIVDSSGNELIKFAKTATAVNEITITNAATGTTGPLISSTGETNVDLRLGAAGTGKIVPTRPVNFGAFTAYFTETDNGNSSTADTIDWGVSNKQKSTLTGNCTFTFTAPPGPCSLVLKLVQDGTGSRTVTWPAAVHWSGGTAPTLTTTASRVDIICFYYDGSTYFGTSSLNYVA